MLLQKKDTNFRKAAPVKQQVAIGLYYLAGRRSHYDISSKFAVGMTTAQEITNRFCSAVLIQYGHLIQWPQGQVLDKVVHDFFAYEGLPNVHGAIDCTHIRMLRPRGEGVHADSYFDREKNWSIVLQAVCDLQNRFIDVYSGWPGSVHDSRVFANSDLKQAIDAGERLQGRSVNIMNQWVKPYIVGDAGYPTTTYLMVPYPGRNLPQKQSTFNYKHSATRMCIEKTFGILKGRFRVLLDKVPMQKVSKVNSLAMACCALHNLCIDLQDELAENEIVFDEDFDLPFEEVAGCDNAAEGLAMRERVADYLVNV